MSCLQRISAQEWHVLHTRRRWSCIIIIIIIFFFIILCTTLKHRRYRATCTPVSCHPSQNAQIAVLVFQCLTGQAPAYLADDCPLSTRRLRSTDTATCVVRRSNNSFGDRCLAAAGPRVWNVLPIHLRLCDSLEQFKQLLKTHLFAACDRGALWRFS